MIWGPPLTALPLLWVILSSGVIYCAKWREGTSESFFWTIYKKRAIGDSYSAIKFILRSGAPIYREILFVLSPVLPLSLLKNHMHC